MRKRNMVLNCTQAEAEYRLRQQLRIHFPKGTVEENHFRIYKQTTGRFLDIGKSGIYLFDGDYQQSGKQTYISYRIWPNFFVLLFSLLLLPFTFKLFHQAILRNIPPIVAVIVLLFLLCFILITQHEKKSVSKNLKNT